MKLAAQIPEKLLAFLGDRLPRKDAKATEAFVAKMRWAVGNSALKEAILFEAEDTDALSYTIFDLDQEGNIKIRFGSLGRDYSLPWTNDTDFIIDLAQLGYVSDDDAHAYFGPVVTPSLLPEIFDPFNL